MRELNCHTSVGWYPVGREKGLDAGLRWHDRFTSLATELLRWHGN